MHNFVQLYFHLVWSTAGREPRILPDRQSDLYSYIRKKGRENDITIYGVNGTETHIHVAAELKPSTSVADAVKIIKGSSSRFMNQQDGISRFRWQSRYSAFSVSKKDLPRVVEYIRNQKRHHQTGTARSDMEEQ